MVLTIPPALIVPTQCAITQVTGKHVGQLFRKQVDMAQLPAVKNLKPRLTKSNFIDAGTDVDVGLTLLFAEDD